MNVNQLDTTVQSSSGVTTSQEQEIQQLKNDINELQTRIAQEKARLNSLSGTKRILQAGPIYTRIAALNTELAAKQNAYNAATATLGVTP